MAEEEKRTSPEPPLPSPPESSPQPKDPPPESSTSPATFDPSRSNSLKFPLSSATSNRFLGFCFLDFSIMSLQLD